MVELQEIFDIRYGNQFDLNKMQSSDKGVHFVGRSVKNNGVTSSVNELSEVKPYPKGIITVALGGSVLASFLQVKPFYTGQNIAVLTPLKGISLTTAQKLYYCKAIHSNAYRFSTCGREANRTLKYLLVPSLDEIPEWVNDVDLSRFDGVEQSLINENTELPKFEELAPISELFKVVNGIATTGFIEKSAPFENSVMYVRPASTHLRTFRSYIPKGCIDSSKVFPKGTLFVSTNGEGSHTYSYVSTSEFVPNSDVAVLIPKKEMSLELKLFYAKCITANRCLFSYGRKPKGSKLQSIKVPLLSDSQKKQVEAFIQSLPYSKNLE